MSLMSRHPDEHRVYRAMLRRCHDPRDKSYRWYGARGIERAAHAAFEHLRVRGEWFRDDWFIRDFVFTLQAIEAEAEAA